MTSKITYNDKCALEYTSATIKATEGAALELGITKMDVAITSGDSAVEAAERVKGLGITHAMRGYA